MCPDAWYFKMTVACAWCQPEVVQRLLAVCLVATLNLKVTLLLALPAFALHTLRNPNHAVSSCVPCGLFT